ncbi:hypothetical protein PV11_04482 [Exophiala sideris]|uniref:CFEM domain-containing protein n=1 Tax=Exophiala sideris TaxID=1016849 RepID=A0A0D1Z666_9EURO|nr:hypothetical protein PV11_04482 [Exophiala sideris]
MANAQTAAEMELLAALPQCAALCAETILPTSKCALTDIPCMCEDTATLAKVAACSQANCTVVEALNAQNITLSTCGVTPHNDSHTYVVVVSIFLAVAIIFYLIRLYVRPPFTPLFRIDDAIMLVATLSVIVFTGFNLEAAHLGLGQDLWNVPPDNIDTVLKNFFIGEFLYIFIGVLTKLAVLVFELKVFAQPLFQKMGYIVMAGCICYFVAFMFILGFECTPVSFFWTQWRDPSAGKCIDINAGGWAAAAINIALDLCILIIPIPVIMKLQISRQQKLQILSMFGVGSFITVISIIRLQALISFATETNLTYNLLQTSIWSSIELYVSVICACMPATRLFLQRIWPSKFASTGKGSYGNSYVRQPNVVDPAPPQQTTAGMPRNHITKSMDVNVSDVRRNTDEMELREQSEWDVQPKTTTSFIGHAV